EAGEHVPGELPRLAVVEELGGEVRAKLEALQLQEVIRRLSERSQPLVALLGCDQIPGDEGKFHAPQLASLKERDLAGRDGELPCTTKKGVSLLVAGIGIHAQGGDVRGQRVDLSPHVVLSAEGLRRADVVLQVVSISRVMMHDRAVEPGTRVSGSAAKAGLQETEHLRAPSEPVGEEALVAVEGPGLLADQRPALVQRPERLGPDGRARHSGREQRDPERSHRSRQESPPGPESSSSPTLPSSVRRWAEGASRDGGCTGERSVVSGPRVRPPLLAPSPAGTGSHDGEDQPG